MGHTGQLSFLIGTTKFKEIKLIVCCNKIAFLYFLQCLKSDFNKELNTVGSKICCCSDPLCHFAPATIVHHSKNLCPALQSRVNLFAFTPTADGRLRAQQRAFASFSQRVGGIPLLRRFKKGLFVRPIDQSGMLIRQRC